MRIALLQMHSIAGQIEWNANKIAAAMERAAKADIDLVVTPELGLIGYPPDDLLTFQWILAAQTRALAQLSAATSRTGVGLLVGHAEPANDNWFWNTATLFESGRVAGRIRKERLPSYNVFAESRHFVAYPEGQPLLTFRDKKLGVTICEDAWDQIEAYGPLFLRKYPGIAPALSDERRGCDLHINLSASPYEWNKSARRDVAFGALARKIGKPFLWVNRVGGQDEALFDGQSAVYDASGAPLQRATTSEEDFLVWDETKTSASIEAPISPWETLSRMLQRGLRDFVHQSRARGVLVGLSGGVDSACVAALAVKALGPANVLGVSLPAAVTSHDSIQLARDVATRLGIELNEIPIAGLVNEAARTLGLTHESLPFENLQSRVRGLLLMGEANRSGKLLLACGNKSEYATGYGTLYGDIAGALAPLGDLLKTQVYGLCHYWNRQNEVVPQAIIERAPTAELAPGQRDSDSLPPYEILDAFLYELLDRQGQAFVEKDWAGFLKKFTAQELIKKVMGAEFKRYQAPPILRIQNRAFGRSWQMPIATSLPLE